jgi:hypothetical protein
MRAIRNFVLHLSDADGTPLDSFSVPVEGAAFFVNPLFRALLGAGATQLHEPWYTLVPRRLTTGPLNAPTIPAPTLPPTSGMLPIEIVPDPTDPIRALTVTLYDLEQELYTADYTTTEVFGPMLTLLIQRRITDGRYRADAGPFRLLIEPTRGGGDMQVFTLLPEDAPVEGVFPLHVPRRSGSRATFQRVTEHTFDTRTLADFGALQTRKPELPGTRRLIWQPAAYEALIHSQPVSNAVEVGGYLVGQVYTQADAPETLLVDVQHVLAAVGTQASAALLLFTGDSWSALRRRLSSDLRGLRLVGWWHTHLFPATDDFGLSGLDEALHRQFFSNPWHFAALLNVSREQGRVLRCYQPDEQNVLQESSYLVSEARPTADAPDQQATLT